MEHNKINAYADKITQVSTVINGIEMTLEHGRFAEQATSAILATMGDTQVLSIVTMGAEKPDIGYFPMSVEYQERLYAGGKIKGSRWIKREGRPSDDEILNARLIDRSARPLFPGHLRRDLQIINMVLSVDGINDPAILAANATYAALAISPIPWNGPLATVRIGLDDHQFLINPTNGQRESSRLDLVVSTSAEKIVMIEAGGNQISENKIIEAINLAHQTAVPVIAIINELVDKVGQEKLTFLEPQINPDLQNEVTQLVKKYLEDIKTAGKTPTHTEIEPTIYEQLSDNYELKDLKLAFEKSWKMQIRQQIKSGTRPDGRKFDQIRSLGADVGLLKRTHGSGIFRRGSTHVLSIAALATPSFSQIIESAADEEVKRFIHYYSMPPFSTGETGKMFTSRREIGHGSLAEKALEPVIPSLDEFPYTIMVVSEVMSSNGSTSMGSTCGTTLALMDAGVPIKDPVSGIAMGLIYDGPDGPIILTDIAGIEDFNGDMDFKVAGTQNGITAIQLDIKISGLEPELVEQIITEAKTARMEIMQTMLQAINKPREQISQYAPKIKVIRISAEKIGEIIGPGGKMIRRITAETQADIDVEDDGKVTISSIDQASLDKAVKWVKDLTTDPEIGQIYTGKVMRVVDFGAFVEILPGKEGLVHVSRMSHDFINSPLDIVHEGQEVQVKVFEIDELGRVNLTMLLDSDGSASEDRGPQRRHTIGAGRSFSGGRGNRPFNDRGPRRSSGGPSPRRNFNGGNRMTPDTPNRRNG
jgi:polyribonucleotide nucleotidyltransferase